MTFVSFLFMTLVFIALICFPKVFNLSELSLPPTLSNSYYPLGKWNLEDSPAPLLCPFIPVVLFFSAIWL